MMPLLCLCFFNFEHNCSRVFVSFFFSLCLYVLTTESWRYLCVHVLLARGSHVKTALTEERGKRGGGRRVHNRRHRLFFFFFPQHSTPTYSLPSFLYIFVPLVQGGGIVFPYRVGNCNEMCSLTSLCRCSSQPKSYVTSDHCFFFFSLLHISLFLRHKSQRDSLIFFFFFESNT